MPRLTAPNGSTVHVSDADAEYLLTAGYKAAEEKKAPAKKADAKKSE